jgi:hypothetical protein
MPLWDGRTWLDVSSSNPVRLDRVSRRPLRPKRESLLGRRPGRVCRQYLEF